MRFRSLLFVPMNKYDKKIYQRIAKNADAIVLDLEDALPDSLKNEGRNNLYKAIEIFGTENVFVRINSDDRFKLDMMAVKYLGIKNIIYPKFDMNHKLSFYDLQEFNIIPIVETPHGLYYMHEAMSKIKNICGVIFGAEDLSASLGIQPSKEAMLPFAQQAVLVCAMLGTYCIGYASDFTDLSVEKLRENCERSKSLGFKAAFCIHPTHLDTINEIYTYQTVAIESFKGVDSEDGKMLGPPTLKRLQNQ